MDDLPRCRWANSSAEMQRYHDEEWGILRDDDTRFFEYLCLEIFQAGLSWDTIIRKRPQMRAALCSFDFSRIANFSEHDVDRLMTDTRVIRHRTKIEAIIENARIFERIVSEHGSFLKFLEEHKQDSLDAWIALFRRTFRFMGPEIVREFLESAGMIGTHEPTCHSARLSTSR